MNQSPAFQFYWADFYNSAKVQLMSLEEEAAYKRLLCFQWDAGSIPADLKQQARICKNVPAKKMASMWTQISPCFITNGINGQLINPRMHELREERITFLTAKAEAGRAGGVKSGEARAKQKGSTPSISLEANREANTQAKRTSPSPSPSPSPSGEGNINNSPNTLLPPTDSPATKKRAGRPDEAADLFAAAYLVYVGNPYGWQPGDFPQLAKLRKRLKLTLSIQTPPFWSEALENYFASPLSKFSLQHFAADFDTFKNSPLDRFGKPVNHANAGGNGNGKRETDAEKNNRAVKNAIDRSLAAQVRSDIPDVREDS